MTNDHGSSIKDDETYAALRDKGYDKQKAAAIANAQANDAMNPSRKGGKSPAYEDWTRKELIQRATDLNIQGRWDMRKSQLIRTLHNKKGQTP